MNNEEQRLFSGQRVLITGAAGTIGRELLGQLAQIDCRELRALDNGESELFYLKEDYRSDPRVNAFFADIRDMDRLRYLFRDVDIVIHTAALKHVTISELSPLDAVCTNVNGTANVIQAALDATQVHRVIYTSSDKAVNPTNVMGTTKLLGERLMTSALNLRGERNIVFSSTRFGNVIGSKGSVLPIFYRQIQNGEPITLTDERMTRFIMTIPQAASLVLAAASRAKGGEVFVTKMPVVRIKDLAHAMIDLVAPRFGRDPQSIEIRLVGAKPGEKFYEELMTSEETSRATELEDMFMVRPAIPPLYAEIDYGSYEGIVTENVTNPYISKDERCLTLDELKKFLAQNRVIETMTI